MTKKEIEKVLAGEGSKSAKMKELYNGGCEIGEIAKMMGVRYNFVYNVVSVAAMKAGETVRVQRKQGEKKAAIRAMIDEGKTNKEISEATGTFYNYVFKVRKEYEAELRAVKTQA